MPNMLALMQEYYAQISLNNAASLLGVCNPSVTAAATGSAFNAITKITRFLTLTKLKHIV